MAMLCAWSPLAWAAEDAAQELGAVVQELNALDEWLDAAGKRLADQQRELADADRAVADLVTRSRDMGERIDAAQRALGELEEQRTVLVAQREALSLAVAADIGASWRLAGHDAVKLWLNQEDPAAFERMARYHGYFAEARAETVAELRETLGGLAANSLGLEAEELSLRASRTALKQHGEALQTQRSERAARIADLKGELSAKGRERERLANDRRRLEALLRQLQRKAEGAATPGREGSPSRIVRSDPAQVVKGQLRWPVQGEVVRRFGQPRAGGRMRWQGVYISAPLGADVLAVARGEVVFADWLRGFGMLTIIDHGAGRLSLYGHSDALYRGIGDRVGGGEVIASVGQSGGEADAGLYFEIREGGQPTDPLAWLRRR